MTKRLSMIVLVTIMMIGVFGLMACRNEHTVYEEGYFQYIIVGENNRYPNKDNKAVVAIVGFTESGKEQEVIDFPRVIDGKPVVMLGYRDEGFYHNNSHHIYSEKLEKIYVHDNIKNIVNFEGLEVDVMLCSINDDLNFNEYGFFRSIYIYKTIFEGASHNSNIFPANIEFLNNYFNEFNMDYYWLDNIAQGDKISEPPNPKRNGYEFTGWYTESECINAWDFDNEPAMSANTVFRLYANWRSI